VQYWVDSLGFHQNDNLPKLELQPVTDTPEVRKARQEHERLWKEAARLNGIDTDSSDLYSSTAERLENDSYDDEQELEGQVSNQHQSLARYPILPYSQHIAPNNAKTFGKVVDDSVIVESRKQEARARFARQQESETEEVTSEPRGFFYSFDYQVPFIVEKNSQAKRELDEQASERFESPIDLHSSHDSVQAKSVGGAEYAEPQSPRVSENIQNKIIPQDEVHDVQTSPKQQPIIVLEDEVSDVKANLEQSSTVRTESEVHDTQISPKQRPSRASAPQAIEKETKPSPKQTVNRGRGSVKFSARTT
jgi:hypothetical protein